MRLGSSRALYYRPQTAHFFDEPRTAARFLLALEANRDFPWIFLLPNR